MLMLVSSDLHLFPKLLYDVNNDLLAVTFSTGCNVVITLSIYSSNVGKLVHLHSHHNSVFLKDLSQRTMLFTIPICIHFEAVLLSFCTLKFVRPRLYQKTSTYKQQTAVSISGNPQMRMSEMFSLTH